MFIESKVRGFDVCLDTDVNGDGDLSPERVTGCWINFKNYSGSLECALAYGGLEDRDGNFLKISDPDLDTLENWASARGY
jgi:hypothetical protein